MDNHYCFVQYLMLQTLLLFKKYSVLVQFALGIIIKYNLISKDRPIEHTTSCVLLKNYDHNYQIYSVSVPKKKISCS